MEDGAGNDLPSSILYPLSSILHPLSSILHPLSSILHPPSSIFYPRLFPTSSRQPDELNIIPVTPLASSEAR